MPFRFFVNPTVFGKGCPRLETKTRKDNTKVVNSTAHNGGSSRAVASTAATFQIENSDKFEGH